MVWYTTLIINFYKRENIKCTSQSTSHNTSKSPNECAEDDLVFDDDCLKWSNVGRAVGVEEERFNMSEFTREDNGFSSSSLDTPNEEETLI